jgi:hypothetical protein
VTGAGTNSERDVETQVTSAISVVETPSAANMGVRIIQLLLADYQVLVRGNGVQGFLCPIGPGDHLCSTAIRNFDHCADSISIQAAAAQLTVR